MSLWNPFSPPGKIAVFYGAIIATLFALYVTILFIGKNRTKKSPIIRYLIWTMFFLAIAAAMDPISMILDVYSPQFKEIGIVSLATVISFTANGLSNVFLLQFIKHVFHDNEKKPLWGIIYFIEIIVGPVLLVNYFYENELIELPALGIHVICYLFIAIRLSVDSIRLRNKLKKLDDSSKVETRSLSYIAISGFFFIAGVLMFVAHEVIPVIGLQRIYIIPAMGWIIGAFAGLVVYIGYIVPDWIRKRWEK